MRTYLQATCLRLLLLGVAGCSFWTSAPALPLTDVSQEEATAVARNWVQSCVIRYGDWGGTDVPAVGEITPLFAAGGRGRLLAYVVEIQPTGFVLVPAVRELPPVKSYSATDAFSVENEFCGSLLQSLDSTISALAAVTADRAGNVSTAANQQSWGTFLAVPTRADSYTGIAGVKFSMRVPILDSASYSGGYSKPLVWHSGTPYRNKCPKVETVPEVIWIGAATYFKGTPMWNVYNSKDLPADKVTPGSSLTLYYDDVDDDGALGYVPNPANTEKILSFTEPVWKDEPGGTAGRYDYGIDTCVWPPMSPDAAAYWKNVANVHVKQAGMYYYDADGSQDYTYTTGYTSGGSLVVGMAELMRYWEWPNIGVGAHSYPWAYKEGSDLLTPVPASTQAITLTANFAHAYSWSKMPLNGLGSFSQTEQDNVAQLIYEVATCFNANFQRKVSVVDFSQNSLNRIADHFLYNHRAMSFVARKDFAGDDAWFARLQEELDAHRPVLLRNFLGDGTFVSPILDGYDKAADSANLYLVHCNLFGNRYWFALDNIGGIPQLLGEGGAVLESGNILQQDAIVNVLPQRAKPVLLVEAFSVTGDAQGITMAGALQGLANSYKSSYYFDDVTGLGGIKGVRYVWADGSGGVSGVYNAASDTKVSPNAADPGWAGINGVAGVAMAAKVAVLSYRPNALDANAPGVGTAAATLMTEQMTQYGIFAPLVNPVVVVNGQSQTMITGSGVGATDLLALRAEALRRSSPMSKFLVGGDCILGETPQENKPVFQADVYVSRLDEDVPDSTSLTLKLVLAENKNVNDMWIVRDLLAKETITLGYGQTHVVHVPSFQLPPNASWTLANCRVIAFLEQADGTIAQAGMLTQFVPGPNYLLDAEQAKYTSQLLNRPPVAPTAVTLTQAADKSATASAVGAYDPDGDAIVYLYAWSLNGVPMLTNTSPNAVDTVGRPDIAFGAVVGDLLTCEVRVRDEYYDNSRAVDWIGNGKHESSTVVSNDLLYLAGGVPPQTNHAPSVPTMVLLDPPGPAAGEPITCLSSGAADLDGDAVSYLYTWSRIVAGVPVASGDTSALLPYGVTVAGETWRCDVVARDTWGASSAPAVSSTTVLIAASRSGAPSAPLNVTIGPTEPSYTATLSCGVPLGIACPADVISPARWTADNYTVNFRWWKRTSNVWLPTANTGASVVLKKADIGSVWKCQVYAVNNSANVIANGAVGPSVYSNEVLVRNFAPLAPAVSLPSTNVQRNQDLACTLLWSIDKEDGELNTINSYYFEWYLNGQPSGIYGLGVNKVTKDRLVTSQKWFSRVWAVDSLGARSAMVKTGEAMVGTPPTTPTGVTLSPGRPEVGDLITCLHESSTSADGNTVTYEYAWYKYQPLPQGSTVQALMPAGFDGNDNLTPEAGYWWGDTPVVTQKTLTSAAYADGDRWICAVRATDGVLTSSWSGSSYAVLIGNQPPTSPVVTITPANPKAGQGIACSASGSVDPNGGVSVTPAPKLYGVDDNATLTYSYQWEYKRAGAAAWALGPTAAGLNAAVTQVGDVWRCGVVVSDNYAPNPRQASPTYSQEISFVQVPPTGPATVTIEPAFPKAGQSLLCRASGGTDKSGDPVSYVFTWTRSSLPAYVRTSTDVAVSLPIPGTDVTLNGETWTCSVVSTNGTLTSAPAVTVSVTVQNMPPSAPSTVAVTPNPAGMMTDLVCTAGGATDPNGDTVTYAYLWNLLSGAESSTHDGIYDQYRLKATNLALDQVWTCSVHATDGGATPGSTKVSAPVRIQNLAPSAPATVTLSPAQPTELDDLVCAASGAVDPEGTAVVYSYRWFRNEVQTALTTQAVSAGTLAVGDSWTCEATATDDVKNASPATTSAAVTIRSASPSNPTVTVTPTVPSLKTGLLCTASNSVDPLGGTVTYVYAWYVRSNEAVYGGPDGWSNADTPVGTPGIQAGLYFYDADGNGVYSPGENIWKDRVGGTAGVYDNVTQQVYSPQGWVAPVGTAGTQTGLYYANTVPDGVYTAGEDIWADPTGGPDNTYHNATVWRLTGITSAAVSGGQGILSFGDTWKCLVYAWNSVNKESGRVTSNEVSLSNRRPSAPTQIVLAPTIPVMGGKLTCTASGSIDPDGATVTTYRYIWQNDNGAFNGPWQEDKRETINTPPSSSSVIAKDLVRWRCLVSAVDPLDATATLLSDEVASNEVRVTGTAPNPATVAAELDRIGGYLVCRAWGGTDQQTTNPNDLTYLFTWYRGPSAAGISGPGAYDATTAKWVNKVPLSFAATGDVWTCSVTVIDPDGAQSTAVVSNQVPIANQAPLKPTSAAIWPSSPTLNNFLLCQVTPATAVDLDAGDTAVYFFRWFKNGVEQTLYNGPQLPSSAIKQGEHWYCQVYARDSFGSTSDSLGSSAVVIGSATGDNYEVDNDPSLARAIGANEWQARSLTPGSTQDVDWVLLRLDGASEVRIRANLVSGTATFSLTLYEKNEVANTTTLLTTGGGDITRMLKPGAYLILVQATNVLAQTVIYGLQTTTVNGRSIGSGPTGDFTQTQSDPEDWFNFVLVNPATVSLTTAITSGTGSLVLAVFDSTYQHAYGGTGASVTNQNLPAGQYFVRVTGSGIPVGGSLVYRMTLAPDGIAINALPLAPTVVQVLPEQPPVSTELHAVAYGARKPDGSPATTLRYWFNWYQNGFYRPDLSGLKTETNNYLVTRIDPANVKEGDTWRCEVYAQDDYDGSASSRVSSNTVTVGPLPDWSVTVSAQGTAQAHVTFGQTKNATDGWDEGLDELAPQLGFPSAGIQVYFEGVLPSGTAVYLSKDYRSFGTVREEWIFRVNPRDVMQLTWDASTVPNSLALILTQLDNPQNKNVIGADMDMRTQGSLSLAGMTGDTLTFRILVVSVGTSVERISLKTGWNLISFALSGVDDSVGSIFGGRNLGAIWGFSNAENRYTDVSTIQVKVGYWVYVSADVTIEHIGRPDLWGKIALNPGWNLIGPARTCVVPFNPAISRNSVFTYDAATRSYEYGTLLKVNQGYWLSSSLAVELEFR